MLELIWIALACAATAMVLGMLWWGALFGKPWMAAMGWEDLSEAELEEKKKAGGPGYAISIVGAIIGGLALWFIFDQSASAWQQFTKPGYGLMLGLLVAIGLYLPATAVTLFFESRNWTLWKIDAGYRLIVFGLWGLWVGLLHV